MRRGLRSAEPVATGFGRTGPASSGAQYSGMRGGCLGLFSGELRREHFADENVLRTEIEA